MPTERRVYSPDLSSELLSFCDAHPFGTFDGPVRARLLTRLTSGPDRVVDVWQDGQRALVAVVLDALSEPSDTVVIEVLGARPPGDWATGVRVVLAEADRAARQAGRGRIESGWPLPAPAAVEETLAAAGHRPSHCHYRMVRAPAAPPPPAPLPGGWSFREVDEGDVPTWRALALASFTAAGLPAYIPPQDELVRSQLAERPRPLLLWEGSTPIGFLRTRHNASTGTGEIAHLGRAPSHRGRGLGRLLLGEGLRRLHAAGAGDIELAVAAHNDVALGLYRAFGFELTTTVVTYEGRLAIGSSARS